MFHLAAWLDTAGSAGTIDMPPIPDGILSVVNGHFIPANDMQILAGYASGAHLGRARFNSATIRQINPSYIRPVNANLLPVTDPPILSLIRNPLKIRGQEELLAELIQSANTAEDSYVLAWLQASYEAAPVGDPYTIRFSATQTAVAGAWTLAQYNLEQGLPVGNYTMIWSELFATTGIAHRWTFDNQFWRPGHLSFADETLRSYRECYQAHFGAMGQFRTFNYPRLEILCDSADTAFSGYMTVVRTGP